MNLRKYRVLILLVVVFNSFQSLAQGKDIMEKWKRKKDSINAVLSKNFVEITGDQFVDLYNAIPNFGMFHDNYFITGIPTNEKIDDGTADVKFQISIRQRLIKSVLPFNTVLLLTYTQKSFWNIYKNSSPFAESNYNPGISLGGPILYNNRLRGMAVISIEHESNGLGGKDSRSWNYLTFSSVFFHSRNISVQTKLWFGKMSEENKDLYNYRGYGLMAFNFRDNNSRIWISLILNPNKNFRSWNTIAEFNWRPNKKDNQYLFLQWYNGYGESLIDYNKYSSMIRFGICIKPPMRNFY